MLFSSIPAIVNRAEHELLLNCIRPEISDVVRKRIRSLASPQLDWEYLFLISRRHSVTPLLFSRLQKVASDCVPAAQLQRLQQYFQQNYARNVVLTAEVCRLIELLADQHIESIPYKGPALATFAYNDISLRRFVDLDIMVRRDEASRAIEALLKDGYEFSKPLTSSQVEVLLRTQHNVQLRKHNRQMIVELHWEVASHLFASSVQADDFWHHLQSLRLNQFEVKTLATEDLMFSLCVHGSRHLWERLSWICDIAWLMSRQKVSWTALSERARSTQSERMFLLAIALAAKLMGVNPPDSLSNQIASDTQLDKLSDDVIERLFNGTTHRPASSNQIFRYNLLVRKGWPARFRYFRHMLKPTDQDLEAVTLPSSLNFGYYLIRPLRLVLKRSDEIN